MSGSDYLWYIPNENEGGHRGDIGDRGHNSLETLAAHALACEQFGWIGALIGTGWGRPDTFAVATAIAARTTRFEPLIAARPGYWHPVQFASAIATLDHLSAGRVRVNIVSGRDELTAYGDAIVDGAQRYARTAEFMRLLRRQWADEDVDFTGQYYSSQGRSARPRIQDRGGRPYPPLYFGGASAAAEQVAAGQADVQLFWGEPLDGVAERIERLKQLSRNLDRDLPPLEFGLRITTVVRDTSEEAWAVAEAKVAKMAEGWNDSDQLHLKAAAAGQQRLLALQQRGDVLDDNLYTAPGRYGAGGAATTWLVGSAEEVARSLRKYQALGVRHFILSDTPYRAELERQGRDLLPLLRDSGDAVA